MGKEDEKGQPRADRFSRTRHWRVAVGWGIPGTGTLRCGSGEAGEILLGGRLRFKSGFESPTGW